MAFTKLRRDQNGIPLQALTPNLAVNGTVGAVSASLVLPPECDYVRVASVNDCYIRFGTSGVTAAGTDIFFPKGSEVLGVPEGATHLAYIQHTTGGVISVTSMI